jgi:hypothetical protein
MSFQKPYKLTLVDYCKKKKKQEYTGRMLECCRLQRGVKNQALEVPGTTELCSSVRGFSFKNMTVHKIK